MKKFKGEIRNEKGEVIFSRKGNFENKELCFESLKERVLVDVPSKHSLVHNMIYGGSFENSPYFLGRYYNDISKLTFSVEELN
jgi:hypothetical protein